MSFLEQSRRLNSPQNYIKFLKFANIMILNLRNGDSIECEQIRFCALSSGVRIGLFRDFAPCGKYTGSYILVVKQGKQFLHQFRMLTLVSAIQSYLDYICRYA